jgi:hypothetical protein
VLRVLKVRELRNLRNCCIIKLIKKEK